MASEEQVTTLAVDIKSSCRDAYFFCDDFASYNKPYTALLTLYTITPTKPVKAFEPDYSKTSRGYDVGPTS